MQKALTTDAMFEAFYVTVPTSSNTIRAVFLYDFTASCLQAMVSMHLQTTASPEEELLQVYVRARAITCPIFQWFVRLCEIMSTNCQSSCISKHSYMHNHASYMLMHLLKLSCCSYASALSIPMINLNQNQSCQFQIRNCHDNFKIQQSCQFQTLATFSKFKLLPSCQVNFNLFLQYNLFLLTAKWLVRTQEQLVPANSLLLSVKQQVRIQEQLVPVNLFLLSVK